jgi:hypothetical protein
MPRLHLKCFLPYLLPSVYVFTVPTTTTFWRYCSYEFLTYMRTKESTVRDLAQHSEYQCPNFFIGLRLIDWKKKKYVPTKLQIVYYVTKLTDFNNIFFICTIWHDFMVHVYILILLAPISKARSSKSQVLRNSKMLKSIMCRSLILDFTRVKK